MKLQSILMPLSEFDHVEKGDALYGKPQAHVFMIPLRHISFDLFIYSCVICDIFYDRSAKHSLRRYVTFFLFISFQEGTIYCPKKKKKRKGLFVNENSYTELVA